MVESVRNRSQGSRTGERRVRISGTSRDEEGERRPLLEGNAFSHHGMEDEPVFSCPTTHQVSHLPVYTNIHRIRRDVISIVEDYLTLEQLRDVRINVSVVRPLVDKLCDLDDISIGTVHPHHSVLPR